ncbi:MAG: hypothetical protein V3S51_08440 [Dehalococcoidia bacterium]
MSNALVALIVIGLMLVAALSLSNASFNWIDSTTQSWKEMVETSESVSRTDIEVMSANTTAPYVEALVRNSGKVHIREFSNWDVLVQYYDGNSTYYINWLSHDSGTDPPDNQWAVATIYSDDSLAQQEVFEPGILNPGEVVLLRLRLVPQPGAGTTNLLAVSSPNGVYTSAQFQG